MKSPNIPSSRLALTALGMAALSLNPAWGQSPIATSAKQESKQYAKLEADHTTVASPTAESGAVANRYLIGNDDVLTVNVWKEPDISRSVTVRSDGKVSLPLIGEVQATGRTPKELESDIAKGLHDYISEPEVTVIVQESKSQRFSILGQVQRPGSYLLSGSMRVTDAIAVAGGFRDFAKVKSVRVLREQAGGTQISLHFNYKDVIKGMNPEQNVQLEPRDTIYVP
jgi:polysaccharide biosynthesis/export protein